VNEKELAQKWRTEHGYVGRGGVIVICDGVVNSWVNELRDSGDWIPGCVAVDEVGNQWVTTGGNSQTGAERWEPVDSTTKFG
jgi:hypothetical protein